MLQSIPSFDFYLAPFVRTTFEEEIEKYLKFMTDVDTTKISSLFSNETFENKFNKIIKNITVLNYNSYTFETKGLNKKQEEFLKPIIKHSIFRTQRRVHQAMESFIHNMNTMHSRGGEIN